MKTSLVYAAAINAAAVVSLAVALPLPVGLQRTATVSEAQPGVLQSGGEARAHLYDVAAYHSLPISRNNSAHGAELLSVRTLIDGIRSVGAAKSVAELGEAASKLTDSAGSSRTPGPSQADDALELNAKSKSIAKSSRAKQGSSKTTLLTPAPSNSLQSPHKAALLEVILNRPVGAPVGGSLKMSDEEILDLLPPPLPVGYSGHVKWTEEQRRRGKKITNLRSYLRKRIERKALAAATAEGRQTRAETAAYPLLDLFPTHDGIHGHGKLCPSSPQAPIATGVQDSREAMIWPSLSSTSTSSPRTSTPSNKMKEFDLNRPPSSSPVSP